MTQATITEDTDILKIRVRAKRFVENAGFVIDTDDEGNTSEVAITGGIASLANTFPAIVSTKGICFNANGESFRTLDSTFFVSDENFEGGIGIMDIEEIAETDDDLLFQSAREGEFKYNIPLPRGRYRTQLFYSEFNDLGANRLMNITAEGALLRSEFDILSEVQAIRTAFIDTLLIDVEDDTLNLDFQKATNSLLNPLISAICLDFADSLLQLVPVELASFSGTLRNGNGHLSWESYSEVGFSHYEVQKSNTRNQWTSIGMVRGGKTYYDFTDRSLEAGKIVYYRLKMVDLNGTIEFSHTISLSSDRDITKIAVYPNPTSNFLFVDLSN